MASNALKKVWIGLLACRSTVKRLTFPALKASGGFIGVNVPAYSGEPRSGFTPDSLESTLQQGCICEWTEHVKAIKKIIK